MGLCWTQGCGNSELAEQLARAHGLVTDADDTYAVREAGDSERSASLARARPPCCVQVEAVDYAPRMMQHMRARASPFLGRCVLQYAVMDAQRLGFRDGAFDTVIDKGAYTLRPHPSPSACATTDFLSVPLKAKPGTLRTAECR